MFGAGVFIDVRKAFDSVCHARLIEKLPSYGITLLTWFVSYLNNRRQFVDSFGWSARSSCRLRYESTEFRSLKYTKLCFLQRSRPEELADHRDHRVMSWFLHEYRKARCWVRPSLTYLRMIYLSS
eukprot:Pompholyxophrys_punicea_v1_NODE_196_length_2826_cov_13.424035.p1 type:complete len:125 gc:universal NODE_196_length_2826_cov_13.424035:961-587(-)